MNMSQGNGWAWRQLWWWWLSFWSPLPLTSQQQQKIASTQCLMLFNISLRRHSHKCMPSFLMMLMYKKHFLFPWYCRGSEVKKMHSRALHVYSVPKVSVAINAKWLNVLSPFFCLSISDHTVGLNDNMEYKFIFRGIIILLSEWNLLQILDTQ